MRLSQDGTVTFFRVADGGVVNQTTLPVPTGHSISTYAAGAASSGVVGLGFTDGTALVFKYGYATTYPDNKRVLTPKIEFPLGESPIKLFAPARPVTKLAVQSVEDKSTLIGFSADGESQIVAFESKESFLEDETTLAEERGTLADIPAGLRFVLLNREQNALFVATADNHVYHYNLSEKTSPRLVEKIRLADPGADVTDLRFLAGGVSLLVATSDGKVSQWFTVRDASNASRLTRIRQFDTPANGASIIEPELFRKGFLVGAPNGELGLYHATADSRLTVETATQAQIIKLAIAPRADVALVEDANHQISIWDVDNEHPEISWSALWGKVWYEGYSEPAYIWQSSSASNDFEPKFSLAPLTFGTLKAAFYAMIIAMPLAILGAAYAAYFMSRRLRQVVKPTIEVMEALPTVILGFLAGLWLAPYVEEHLPGIFSLIIVLPIGVLLVAYLWHLAPARIRHAVPDGWQPLLLVPVILFFMWASMGLSPVIEQTWFGGDMPLWLRDNGIDFDQRNALVVGIAMGFAVIPNIFSIAEDAIFAVPRHLTSGSLALGATPWQTFVRVVLPTASPGIFSATMIGLGRAVGETMIVLMATGNTPVMEASIFEGLRTLSANIAVEMPESEVNSTHYRVLFLAALVLFLFTFVFNTLAEVIRQRLRKKYSNL
jgi:phosphate transport system permease protein